MTLSENSFNAMRELIRPENSKGVSSWFMHVLVAPDKFKGSLSAQDAAAAIAEGWRAGSRGQP